MRPDLALLAFLAWSAPFVREGYRARVAEAEARDQLHRLTGSQAPASTRPPRRLSGDSAGRGSKLPALPAPAVQEGNA